MLTLLPCIHIRIPRAIPHSSVQSTMAPSELFQATASPRFLAEHLQPPVLVSVPAGSGKLVGRSLGAHRQRASRNSLQSGVSVRVSSDSDEVIAGRGVSQDTSNKVLMPESLQKTKHVSNHVLYTPMAEMRRNYETVLSWLQPVSSHSAPSDLPQRSRQVGPAPGSSGLPRAPFREFADELLADIDVREYQLSSEEKALAC